MSGRKLSHTILFIEMLVITWPVSVLILMFSPNVVLLMVMENPSAATMAISPVWWLFSAGGGLISLSALAAVLFLDFSPDALGTTDDFPSHFSLFVIGLPLNVPLLHMAVDRFILSRRSES